MSLKKFRWSRVYESSEEELINLLKNRNISSTRTYQKSGEVQMGQINETNITIWCAEGSLRIESGSDNISLQPGDALRIDANINYSIYPGLTDCAYYLTA
jgi:hypothetical protein